MQGPQPRSEGSQQWNLRPRDFWGHGTAYLASREDGPQLHGYHQQRENFGLWGSWELPALGLVLLSACGLFTELSLEGQRGPRSGG